MAETFLTPGWPPEWPDPAVPPIPTPAPSATPQWIAAPPAKDDDWLVQRLFDNRIVLVHGVLDRDAATRLTAQLLALDAAAQRPIRIQIDSPAADLSAALLVADTLDLVRVSTHALVIGEVGGGALALLMAAHHRLAYPHARIRLTEPHTGTLADDAVSSAQQHAALLTEFVDRLAQVTRRPAEQIAADLRRGRYLTAAEAVDYGLLDSVAVADPAD